MKKEKRKIGQVCVWWDKRGCCSRRFASQRRESRTSRQKNQGQQACAEARTGGRTGPRCSVDSGYGLGRVQTTYVAYLPNLTKQQPSAGRVCRSGAALRLGASQQHWKSRVHAATYPSPSARSYHRAVACGSPKKKISSVGDGLGPFFFFSGELWGRGADVGTGTCATPAVGGARLESVYFFLRVCPVLAGQHRTSSDNVRACLAEHALIITLTTRSRGRRAREALGAGHAGEVLGC